MISNERQYRITKAEADRFRRALEELERNSGAQEGVHPRLVKAQLDAVQSQLDDLREELSEYELLKAGDVPVIQINSFDELGDGLVKARIAAGLSQKELGARLNLKEQQIQRYEADRFASASLQRLQDVAQAIGVKIRKEILMPFAPTNYNSLVAKLAQAGLEKDFLQSRLLPTSDVARLEGNMEAADEDAYVRRAADVASRIYGWSTEELFAPAPLAPPRFAAAEARFKIPSKRNRRSTSLYAAYANYLAVVVLKACELLPLRPVPHDAAAFRKVFLSKYDAINLESVLHFAWDLGVPVLPLKDRGTFHGACWRYDARNVVVLKQTSRHMSRWLFDLLHELFHAAQNPDQSSFEVLEADENSAERRDSEEEVAASQFAGDVLLQGKAEEIAQACVRRAHGSVERLKNVVPEMANEFRVEVGAVANYLAFRLSWQGISWWGAASNLQKDDGDPWEAARDVFLERFPFEVHSEVDRQLLTRALQ